MKKVVAIALSIAMVIAISATVYAKKGKSGQAGKSNVGHLYLCEKDPDTWDIVEDGAWGKMNYNLSGPEFEFVFNGHSLEPGEEYTLIYYPDPWPGDGLICLGSGAANGGGNVHIEGAVDTGDLPADYDGNHPDNEPDYAGAKIWLVLSSDVNCEEQYMSGWNPTEYLFEYDRITFDDTDDEEEGTGAAMAPAAPGKYLPATTWARIKSQ